MPTPLAPLIDLRIPNSPTPLIEPIPLPVSQSVHAKSNDQSTHANPAADHASADRVTVSPVAPVDLAQTSLEELWILFPIELAPHQQRWSTWFRQEQERLASFMPRGANTRISHIGSTAVEDIGAKPIISILLEADFADFSRI